MYNEQGKKEMHTEFWWEKQKASILLEDKAECNAKLTEEQDLKTGTGFN
jgi:hypothetical protein